VVHDTGVQVPNGGRVSDTEEEHGMFLNCNLRAKGETSSQESWTTSVPGLLFRECNKPAVATRRFISCFPISSLGAKCRHSTGQTKETAMLDRYPLHDLLESRRTALGLILNMASPPLVEIASLMGFDWVMIDAEHGPIDAIDAEPMIRQAELAGIAPIVRVGSSQPEVALRYLDLGAVGIMFPHIKTAEQARAACDAVRFPPMGRRGAAPSTYAAGFGTRMPYKQYMQHTNSLLLPMMIIEDPEAVENIEAIVRVEGIAVIVIGAMDLCTSMGFPGDPSAPEVEAAMDKIISACKAVNMPICLAGGSMEASKRNLVRGADMLFTPIGSWLASYGKVYTDGVRGAGK
jgi:4-hydroxy-2-oxoheptanedioate aldolase